MSFSGKDRQYALDQMQAQPLDLLVVGGGLVGTSIAAHAATAGLLVGLVERTDWAVGASGNSSGLIHAGLRYLAQGHVSYVLRAARERHQLETIAPHWVRPFEFIMPAYDRDLYSFRTLRFGTWLYDQLSRWSARWARQPLPPRYQVLSATAVLDRIPGLKPEGLSGGLAYSVDAQIQDSRFTMGVAQAAARAGARVANYADVLEIRQRGDGGALVRILDRQTVQTLEVSCRLIVNATGAWIDSVRHQAGLSGLKVRPSRGIHLVVDPVAPSPLIFSTKTPGKVFFVLPAFNGEASLVGTTDSAVLGRPDESKPEAREVTELLQRLFALFPYLKQGTSLQDAMRLYTQVHVRSVYWGERPLLFQSGETLNASREHELIKDTTYFWSIPGVKLTSGWSVGRDVAHEAYQTLRERPPKVKTIDSLPGGELWDYDRFLKEAQGRFRLGEKSDEIIRYLVSMYGTRYIDVLQWANREPHYRERVLESEPWILAQVAFAVQEEMVLTLNDLLWRRTKWALQRHLPDETIHGIAQEMTELLGWSAQTRQSQIQAYEDEWRRHQVPL